MEASDLSMKEICCGQLKLYSNISETPVDWLWYPYIPFGKLTLIQGDPGCGKSTLMMKLISAATNGEPMPKVAQSKTPFNVIYQCSEDGSGDTIKPRLLAAGADCSKVAFLDEEMSFLTLNDDAIRRAIDEFKAKLLVIDPIQAYLGDADLSNAVGMRKMMRQLSMWAAQYDCAIVLIGHLNKRQSSKGIYRGLGSIDIVASARSVLEIETCDKENGLLSIRHIKSSLAPKGENVYFTIDSYRNIIWSDYKENCKGDPIIVEKVKKQDRAAEMLKVILANGPVKAAEVQNSFSKEKISKKTIILAKKTVGIQSIRKNNAWYWQLPYV